MQRLALSIGMLCASFFVSTQVSAHATPVLYEPQTSQVLEKAPLTVTIHFSERIDPAASSIRVYGPDGADVSAGRSTVGTTDAHYFSVPLKEAGSGTYTVAWQVVSADDGHFTKGGFLFSVGQETGSAGGEGQFQVQHRSDWPEAITIGLELLGEAILLGCLALILCIWRPMRHSTLSPAAATLLQRRIRVLVLCAACFIVLGAGGYIALESSNLAIDQSSTFSLSFSQFIFTTTGRFALYRLLMSMIAAAGFLWILRSMLQSATILKREWILWVLIVLIALLRARVSHAAASAFLPDVSILINTLHLLFKDLWIGGLIVFFFGLLPVLQKENSGSLTLQSLLRFSNMLMLALAVGGITGVYIVWLHLKTPLNLFITHWGGYFVALSSYAFILLTLRLYQQRITHRSMLKVCDGSATTIEQEEAGMIGMVLFSEMLTGLAVLLFSSVLIITTPPLSKHIAYEQVAQTTNARMTFGQDRDDESKFLVSVARTDRVQTGTGETAIISISNAEKGIGPLIVQTEQRFAGGFVFPKTILTSPGTWTVDVVEQEPQVFDAVARFTLQYPDDLLATEKENSSHTPGIFEGILFIIAFSLLVAAWLLYKQNKQLIVLCRSTKDAAKLHLKVRALPFVLILDCSILILVGLTLGNHNHGDRTFLEACRDSGGLWHENVPMRDGRPTSSVSTLGCMIGTGLGTFHFADSRSFNWYTRRTFPHVTLQTNPSALVAGKPVTLTFTLKDRQKNPIERLAREHDRILHTVIISSDFQTFAHVHPEDTGPITPQMLATSTFPVTYTFPHHGTYLIAIDFTAGGKTYGDMFTVNIGDQETGAPILSAPENALVATADGIRATLTLPQHPLQSGTIEKLSYHFEESGSAITNLEPYLSAAMHLSIVRTDLQQFVHTHAELPQTFIDSLFNRRDPTVTHIHAFLPDRFGPDLVSYVVFPTPGRYILFGQVQRNGKIAVMKFSVDVE